MLQYLLDNGVDIVAVITKPDKAPRALATASADSRKNRSFSTKSSPARIPTELVSDPAFAPTLAQYDADLFVVVAYGEIIKQHLLDMPKVACINLHASLLPKYRGAAPIQRCLINGEKETGVTIMHMVKKMDAGDIISSVAVPLDDKINYGELEEKLCTEGCKLLLDVVHDFAKRTPSRIPQEASGVTMAPKIELEECEIDWKRPAKTIHNLVRGVSPSPGAWCYVTLKEQKKRLRVLRTRVATTAPQATPGTIVQWDSHGVIVACGNGALELLEVQLEGKKAMAAAEFARGVKITLN